MSGSPYHYEDFAAGQRFCSPPESVDAAAIKAFAERYDPQPQHIDEAAAARGFFGGLIASGWHTGALTMRLLVTGGLPPIEGGTIGTGVERISWPRPVRPGDRLSVETEILECRPSRSKPAFGLVRFRARTLNQKHEMVQEMTSTLFVPRRARAEGAHASAGAET